MRRIVFTLGLLICIMTSGTAQDLQFSQFYASPLYLNPAFAGSTQGGRVGLNYRNQWPQLGAHFISYAAAFDYHFHEARSSIGVIVKRDELHAGDNIPVTSHDASLIYAYKIPLTDKSFIQPALQVTYAQRSAGHLSTLRFVDQFNDNGFTGNPTEEEFPTDVNSFVDVSTGFVLMSPTYWLGVSAHHLNEPNQSFLDGDSPLPMKLSIHGGYRFSFEDHYSSRDRSIIPAFVYKQQAGSRQLNLGMYANIEPVVFGLWYRGFPVDELNGITQQDSFILMAGLKWDGFSFGYSYDMAINSLNQYNAASHEISLMYYFGSTDIMCPDIWGTGRGNSRHFRRW